MQLTKEQILDAGWREVDDKTFIEHVGHVFYRPNAPHELGILAQDLHQNLSGNVHGGVLMTAFDRVMGVLAGSLRPNQRFATVSFSIDFLRPARSGDFIHLTASITKAGYRIVFVRALASVQSKDIGSASGVFMALK